MKDRCITFTLLLLYAMHEVFTERDELLYYISENRVSRDAAYNMCQLASPVLEFKRGLYTLQVKPSNINAIRESKSFHDKWWVGYYKASINFKNIGCIEEASIRTRFNYNYTCNPGIDCGLGQCYSLCDSDTFGFKNGHCLSDKTSCKDKRCYCLKKDYAFDRITPCIGSENEYFIGVYRKVSVGQDTTQHLNKSHGIITYSKFSEFNDSERIQFKQGYALENNNEYKLMFDYQNGTFVCLCKHATKNLDILTTARVDFSTEKSYTLYIDGTTRSNSYTNHTEMKATKNSDILTTARVDFSTEKSYTLYIDGTTRSNSYNNHTEMKAIGTYAGVAAGCVLLIAASIAFFVWYKRRSRRNANTNMKSIELKEKADCANLNESKKTPEEECDMPTDINQPDIQPTTYLYTTVKKKKTFSDENDYDTTCPNTLEYWDTYNRLGETNRDTYDRVGDVHKTALTKECEMDTYSHVVKIDSTGEGQYDKAVSVQRQGEKRDIGQTTSVYSDDAGLYDTTSVSQLRGYISDNSDYSHVKTTVKGQQQQSSITDCEDGTYNHIVMKNKSK